MPEREALPRGPRLTTGPLEYGTYVLDSSAGGGLAGIFVTNDDFVSSKTCTILVLEVVLLVDHSFLLVWNDRLSIIGEINKTDL